MSISQETFDEVVKENMEEFGLERQAALDEAVQQFKSQGVDMSMVNTTADVSHREALTECLEVLRVCYTEGFAGSQCMEALSKIGDLCRQEGVTGDACRTAFGEAGGVEIVARYLLVDRASSCEGKNVLVAALSSIGEACKNHERNRDSFEETYMAELNSLLSEWIGAVETPGAASERGQKVSGFHECPEGGTGPGSADQLAAATAGLKLVKIVSTKNERNKGLFMRRNGASILLSALERYSSGDGKDAAALREACGALRSVTLGDDMRRDFSGTYDNIKALVSAGAVQMLLDGARAFERDSKTIPWVFLALKQLSANHESVKLVAEHGGLDVISGAITRFPQEVSVCRSSLALFRNISADDALKTRLVNDGGLRLVLGCMSQHKGDKLLQEHGCATMASISLRSPANGARIVSEGGIIALVEAMRRHPAAVGLQRQACLCIRNIAARGPTLRPVMLDEGCEAVLREAGKLRGCIDEAYGALRDLQCEVRLVTMIEGGQLQVGVKAFGEEKPNFDPSLEETRGLDARIAGAAAAPKHAGYMM